MTDAERKRRERDRLREQGKVRRDVWVYPSVWGKVRAYVERQNRAAAKFIEPEDTSQNDDQN